MKKKIALFLVVIMALFVLTGCRSYEYEESLKIYYSIAKGIKDKKNVVIPDGCIVEYKNNHIITITESDSHIKISYDLSENEPKICHISYDASDDIRLGTWFGFLGTIIICCFIAIEAFSVKKK